IVKFDAGFNYGDPRVSIEKAKCAFKVTENGYELTKLEFQTDLFKEMVNSEKENPVANFNFLKKMFLKNSKKKNLEILINYANKEKIIWDFSGLDLRNIVFKMVFSQDDLSEGSDGLFKGAKLGRDQVDWLIESNFGNTLSGSDLSDCDLSDCDLSGCDLSRANLSGITLSNKTKLNDTKYENIVWDENTTFNYQIAGNNKKIIYELPIAPSELLVSKEGKLIGGRLFDILQRAHKNPNSDTAKTLNRHLYESILMKEGDSNLFLLGNISSALLLSEKDKTEIHEKYKEIKSKAAQKSIPAEKKLDQGLIDAINTTLESEVTQARGKAFSAELQRVKFTAIKGGETNELTVPAAVLSENEREEATSGLVARGFALSVETDKAKIDTFKEKCTQGMSTNILYNLFSKLLPSEGYVNTLFNPDQDGLSISFDWGQPALCFERSGDEFLCHIPAQIGFNLTFSDDPDLDIFGSCDYLITHSALSEYTGKRCAQGRAIVFEKFGEDWFINASNQEKKPLREKITNGDAIALLESLPPQGNDTERKVEGGAQSRLEAIAKSFQARMPTACVVEKTTLTTQFVNDALKLKEVVTKGNPVVEKIVRGKKFTEFELGKIIFDAVKKTVQESNKTPEQKVAILAKTAAKLGLLPDLSQMNFSGGDLTKCDYEGINFKDSDLSGANVAGRKFDGAYLCGANFRNCDLRNASFNSKTQFDEKTSFTGAKVSLELVHLLDMRNQQGILKGADLSGINFSGSFEIDGKRHSIDRNHKFDFTGCTINEGTVLTGLNPKKITIGEEGINYKIGDASLLVMPESFIKEFTAMYKKVCEADNKVFGYRWANTVLNDSSMSNDKKLFSIIQHAKETPNS
ncbi:MAG: pentapeptide repeat-containing protein, partial [Gammaproteobacteria bacterium]|nr:pentapeptide repeat-containing protein [Gammaproteobacteria bacterium]